MRLFSYGTLIYPEVMQKIIGRTISPRKAVLRGFRLYHLKGVDYPAIFPDPDAEVKGVIYSGLRQADLRLLDVYEGREYYRARCQVIRASNSFAAWTYVFRESYRFRVAGEGWDPARFRRRHLRQYRHQ